MLPELDATANRLELSADSDRLVSKLLAYSGHDYYPPGQSRVDDDVHLLKRPA